MALTEENYKDAIVLSERILTALKCIYEVEAMNFIFDKDEHKDDWKVAPHFYSTAHQAMIFRFMVEVSKLFDNDTLNFDNFKNKICRANSYEKKIFEEYNLSIKIAKKDIQAIQDRRNKLLAHADNQFLNYEKDHF